MQKKANQKEIVTPPVVSKPKKFVTLHRKLLEMGQSANTSSRDFAGLLGDFGFVLRPPGPAGHIVVTHPAFMLGPDDEANYNGGHSAGAPISRPYIKKFVRLVEANQEALERHLK